MRCRLAAALLLATGARCASESDDTLGGRDAAGPDVIADAATDAGGPTDGAVEPELCRDRPLYLVLSLTEADGAEVPLEAFEMEATVLETVEGGDGIWLALEDGRRLEVRARPDPWRGQKPPEGSRLDARLEVYRPFWTEARLVLTDRGTDRLRAALWDGSSWEEGAFGNVAVGHTEQFCEIEDLCGTVRGLALRVDGFRVRVGEDRLVTPPNRPWLWIMNGASGRYIEGPLCTDTPSRWFQGFVVAPRAPDDCDAISRDACLASPDCALHGSEDRDPGYACFPAAEVCERYDRLGCLARPDLCRWDEGDCYCPEGAVCACGGGPAPGCQRRCNPFTDEVSCAADYYCQPTLGIGGSICLPSVEDARCVRIPASCDGAPNRPECGCVPSAVPEGIPRLYDHRCDLHRDQAIPAPDSLCAR